MVNAETFNSTLSQESKKQNVSQEEKEQHAGLNLAQWNMIQGKLMKRMGIDFWVREGGSKIFKDVMNQLGGNTDLLEGFSEKDESEQDAVIDEIDKAMQERKKM